MQSANKHKETKILQTQFEESSETKLEQVRKFAGIYKNSNYQVDENEWYMQ